MFKIVSGSSENVENTENVENMEITKSPQMALQSQNGARNDQQFCRNQVWWLMEKKFLTKMELDQF